MSSSNQHNRCERRAYDESVDGGTQSCETWAKIIWQPINFALNRILFINSIVNQLYQRKTNNLQIQEGKYLTGHLLKSLTVVKSKPLSSVWIKLIRKQLNRFGTFKLSHFQFSNKKIKNFF